MRVELPIAVPIVIAGLRVAVVSSISLASVGQLIGVSSLGYLIIDGYQRDFRRRFSSAAGSSSRSRSPATWCWCWSAALLTPWQPRHSRREVDAPGGRAAVHRDGGGGR